MFPQQPTIIAPSEPEPPPPSRRDGLLVALAVVLGAAAVLGGLVGFQWLRADSTETAADAAVTGANADENSADDGQSDEDGQQATPSTTNPAPSTTEAEPVPSTEPERPLVESVPCPDRYTEEICAAADFVQQNRGRPFKEFPNIELLDDADFDAALLADFEESRSEFVEDERLMKSLGLIPTDLDLFETFRELIEVGVVGFYDPDDGRLVVRGGEFDLYGQAILVHELVHAFDDQWFDLSRDDFDSDDAEYGYLAVIEGNASRIEELWRDGLDPQQSAELAAQELSSLSPEDLDRMLSLPRILINLQISPYEDGEIYVSGIAAAGGELAVDARFATPPESSEQVLHPGADENTLAIVDVEQPTVDGAVTSDGTIGELLLRFWLGSQAGEGWGGDTFVIWESGNDICTTVDFVADSAADLDEIEAGASRWISGAEDRRSFERIQSVDDEKLRITGCY